MLRRLAVSVALALAACIPNETILTPSLVDACGGDMPSKLRVASYNIKSGAQTSLDEVGSTLSAIGPDVVALQEVNYDPKGEDQPKKLAERLGYPYVFAAALSRGGSHLYGIALISRFSFEHVERIDLRASGAAEPRVAIDATLCVGGRPVRVIATHADVWQPAPNIATLATHLDASVKTPTILLGDLNVNATDPWVAQTLGTHGMVDLIGKYAEGPTFWSDGKRLDYLFVDASLEAQATGASIGASHASDHLPIWADFALK